MARWAPEVTTPELALAAVQGEALRAVCDAIAELTAQVARVAEALNRLENRG